MVFVCPLPWMGSSCSMMLTSGGDPNPPKIQRIFWAVTEGAVASVLLLAGGLDALQAAAVVAGFPFAVVLCLIALSLVRALRWDNLMIHRHRQRYRSDSEAEHNMSGDIHATYVEKAVDTTPDGQPQGQPAE